MEWTLDGVYIAMRKIAGKCAASTDISDLKAITKAADEHISFALIRGSFSRDDSNVTKKLVEAQTAMRSIGKTLGTVQDICTDVVAVTKIYDGISMLSDKRANIIEHGPQRAAAAFDIMFQGFGRLCRFLPPPAKQWGTFLEKFDLFSNYNKSIQLHFGPVHEEVRKIDAQFAPRR